MATQTSIQVPPTPKFVVENQIAMIPILPPREVRTTVDARHLPDLIHVFLTEKRDTVSAGTLRNYRNALRPFVDWWTDVSQRYGHVLSSAAFHDFIRWLDTDYRNPFDHRATNYTKWRITKEVRHLLRWAHRNGYVGVDISNLCPQYQETQKLKFYPSVDELWSLINAAAPPVRLRDAALVAFSVSTGARRFEVVNALAEDLIFDSRWDDLRPGPHQAGYIRLRKVKNDRDGKGLGRLVVFGSHAGLLLKMHLRHDGVQSGPLFDIGSSGVRIAVKKLGRRAGVEKIHPHAFRSALADWWVERHINDGMAADIALKLQLGHAIPSENVTLRYIDLRNERKVLKWLREFHTSPLEAMPWDWSQWPVHRV